MQIIKEFRLAALALVVLSPLALAACAGDIGGQTQVQTSGQTPPADRTDAGAGMR